MQQYLPWILIGLSVLGGIGLLVYNWLQPDEDEDEDYEGADTLMMTSAEGGKKDEFSTTTEEYRGGARKSRMIALKESLEKSLDSREGETVTQKNRMAMPWFLLVGAWGCVCRCPSASPRAARCRHSAASMTRLRQTVGTTFSDGRTRTTSRPSSIPTGSEPVSASCARSWRIFATSCWPHPNGST